MIIDRQLQMSIRQTLPTGTTYASDAIDLQHAQPSAETQIDGLNLICTVHSITGTLTVALEHSSDNSTFTTVTAYPLTAHEAGAPLSFPLAPTKRYIRLKYTASAPANVSAHLGIGVQSWRALGARGME
jgi:hypothetical protein